MRYILRLITEYLPKRHPGLLMFPLVISILLGCVGQGNPYFLRPETPTSTDSTRLSLLNLLDETGEDDMTSDLPSGEGDVISDLPSGEGDVVAPEPTPSAIPFDMDYPEFFDAQWALSNLGEYSYLLRDQEFRISRSSTADVDMNIPEAYELLSKASIGKPVIVAVIDTGIDITHPALAPHIYTNPNEIPLNGIDDDGNGYIDDITGWDFYHNDNTVCHYLTDEDGTVNALPDDNDTHGTHCAGIIASTLGTLGVAAGIDIQILPLKIHGGANRSGSIADAIRAIKYAESLGADICNMSWGTATYSEQLETVMRESSMLFVVAAGNSGSNNNATPMYPANFDLPNMISVAFIDAYGSLSTSSNYGLSTVDLAAPGQDILSTGVGGTYLYQSGSSMATPMVSGIAALLYSCGDFLYPQNVKEIILQTLKPLDSLVGYVRSPGIPDAYAALQAVDLLVSDTTAPTFSPVSGFQGAALAVELNPEDLGGSGIRSVRYAVGKKTLKYFDHGLAGLAIDPKEPFLVSKSGRYTFFISDYAGNESILSYYIQDDETLPTLSADYSRSDDDHYIVSVHAADAESGIKRVRYLEGIYEAKDFLSAGIELSAFNNYSFQAELGKVYTIYTVDYRGNKALIQYEVVSIPCTRIVFSSVELTMNSQESYALCPLLLPYHSTDRLTYTSDNPELVIVAKDGTLFAISPGTVTVTATAESGVSKSCLVHILPADAPIPFLRLAPSTSTDNVPTDLPDTPIDLPDTPTDLPDTPIDLPTIPFSLSDGPDDLYADICAFVFNLKL